MKISILTMATILLFSGCENSATTNPPDRDNTELNERDADGETTTPMDQSNEESDIDLVANIRSQVLEIDNLSTAGRNVKIITEGNKVTLRGPVATASERDEIARVAESIAGPGNVINELEVETE